ncbi:MAG: DNA-3-methyladenine glycosylase 2 family protein [Deltaproteobacteria bacterium]
MTTRRFELGERPFDLRLTWRLSALWGAETWRASDTDGAWFARRTSEGIGTVCVRHRGDHLEAEGWGDGAERALDEVPALVGLEDAGVADVPDAHPLIREIKKRMAGYRMGRTNDVYSQMIAVAIAQKVTGKNSKDALRAIARRWGEEAPGPRRGLYVLPEPRALANTPYYDFHPLNVERHRADLLKRLASRATALQRAVKMSHAEANEHLLKFRGVGPWTAGVVMGSALGDPDAIPVGDYHLPNVITFNLAGEPRGTDERMLELLEPYRGQRGRVVRMLKTGGTAPPKWGPRSSVRDIRNS